MSPEQIRAALGSSEEQVDVRSDVYSLGLIAYELFAGTPPFPCAGEGASLAKMADAVLTARRNPPQPLRSANSTIDPLVEEVISACLAFDPDDRPASAEVVAQRLRTALSWPRQTFQWARRHRRKLQAVAAILVLSVSLLVAVLLSRPPLHVRQLAEAADCARREEFDQAIELTTASLKVDPNNVEALFLRGLAYQGLGENNRDYFGYALRDFNAAVEIHAYPQLEASCGYCLNRGGFHQDAIRRYEAAIASGFDRAVVRNDLGYSHLQRGNFEAALQEFNKAIRQNPNLQAAYYNRAWADLLKSQRLNREPTSGIADLKEALRIGPSTSGLLRDLARLQAVAARYDGAMAEASLQTLERALVAGLDTGTLQKDSLFRAVSQDPRYQEILKRGTANRAGTETPRLLPPVDPAAPPALR